MLDFEHMAIDGQKIQANANYKNSKNLKGIKKEFDKIQEGLEKLLEKEVNEYFTADIKNKRVTTLSKKLDKLDSFQKVEDEREEDFYIPDRRFSASQKEGKGKFHIEKFEKNGDGGYTCPAGNPMEYQRTLTFDDGHTVDLYQGTACADCPLKKRCTNGKKRNINIDSRIPYRDIMRSKLKSEEGREVYMKRHGLIEPVHGDDQKNKGWIQHHLRGFEKASAEFVLMRIATNLALMVKHGEKEILAFIGT